ncbi:hypothetical protein Tco_0038626 [Tanacetum coccineum]
MSDKSSPLKRLVIKINVWVKLPEGENIFTLLRILIQVTLSLSTAWRESHASHYDRVSPKQKYLRYCSERVYLKGSNVQFVVSRSGDCYEDVSRPSVVGVLVTEMVSLEVESEKWKRPLLHWMYDALNVSTDGREEDFFPRNGV